ncbi:exodeoxyribonuclease VII small subunit [Petralouisia muris]|jgi:exodeoxyribonuclease VII small subunit|uniref:Exodeoxyribonuclease VII small subunit n=1 Tax=Petralouisia muris TaxID=3032872 RepID=A0AC61RUN6_9FIRM|nr:exodeoxyribonuclease VII small subunit [Petralouisia muris]TGY95457.1 exodeoxyribonuclease VII small subunit [Petralouisia muris]
MSQKKQQENEKEQSLEEAFQELEEMIEKMQQREVTLEETFALYEQGIRKLKFCNQKIDKVEKKMLLLNEQGELEPLGELETE